MATHFQEIATVQYLKSLKSLIRRFVEIVQSAKSRLKAAPTGESLSSFFFPLPVASCPLPSVLCLLSV
jgi:hypothetical protein